MIALKKIIPLTFLLLPFLAKAQDEDFIEWSPYTKLAWSDYLAKPSPASGAAAITSTTIGVEYHVNNNTLSYSISCRFSKTRSWGKNKTEYILQHEQGHFDITEIYARMLAKELKEYKFNSRKYQDDLNKIYKKVMDEKEGFQNKYDKETDYSRNYEKQVEWLEKIQNELNQTEDFAHYQSAINL
jgi:hypothetical protein